MSAPLGNLWLRVLGRYPRAAGDHYWLWGSGVSTLRDRDTLNLYYRFTPSAWGQGYATELAQRAVSMAREHLPKFPSIARTRPANLASQKVGLLRLPKQESEYVVFALGWEWAKFN